jgi:phosphomannomutase
MSVGCTPIDVGICPTPSIQLATRDTGAAGAIIITGSHNPQGWNALKFVRANGMFLFPSEARELFRTLRQEKFPRCPWNEVGKLEHDSRVISHHIERVLSVVDAASIRKHNFKVVVDACNGAGALATPTLLEELGCRVVRLHCQLSGTFPRLPEPTPANIGELSRTVHASEADVGFAHDADADRLTIVLRGGQALSEEYTVALASYHVLKHTPGPVVVNMSTSSMVDMIARKHSCSVFRTPVGDIHVSRKMQQVKAVIGGEGNGGLIYPVLNYARDGLAAAALILELMATENEDLHTIVNMLPRYHMEKRKVAAALNETGLTDAIHLAFPGAQLNTVDGVRLDLETGWIHIRKSGTEPVVRIICESQDKDECHNLLQWSLEAVQEASEQTRSSHTDL